MNITYKEAAAASENDGGAPNLIVFFGEKKGSKSQLVGQPTCNRVREYPIFLEQMRDYKGFIVKGTVGNWDERLGRNFSRQKCLHVGYEPQCAHMQNNEDTESCLIS